MLFQPELEAQPVEQREALQRERLAALLARLGHPPDAPLHTAAQYMGRSGVHRVLVMSSDELLGIVTTMDITQTVARLQLREPLWLESQPQK